MTSQSSTIKISINSLIYGSPETDTDVPCLIIPIMTSIPEMSRLFQIKEKIIFNYLKKIIF